MMREREDDEREREERREGGGSEGGGGGEEWGAVAVEGLGERRETAEGRKGDTFVSVSTRLV